MVFDGVYEGTNDGSYVRETWRNYTARIDSVLCGDGRKLGHVVAAAAGGAVPRIEFLIVDVLGTVVVKS
jgi:hypothetical protein